MTGMGQSATSDRFRVRLILALSVEADGMRNAAEKAIDRLPSGFILERFEVEGEEMRPDPGTCRLDDLMPKGAR